MIAANEDSSKSLRFGNHFVGIAAIANAVAEIDDQVVGRGSGQTGVQRFEVAVNVAENEEPHKGRIIAFSRKKARFMPRGNRETLQIEEGS
jgi:hypothetical protein